MCVLLRQTLAKKLCTPKIKECHRNVSTGVLFLLGVSPSDVACVNCAFIHPCHTKLLCLDIPTVTAQMTVSHTKNNDIHTQKLDQNKKWLIKESDKSTNILEEIPRVVLSHQKHDTRVPSGVMQRVSHGDVSSTILVSTRRSQRTRIFPAR